MKRLFEKGRNILNQKEYLSHTNKPCQVLELCLISVRVNMLMLELLTEIIANILSNLRFLQLSGISGWIRKLLDKWLLEGLTQLHQV